MNIRKYPVKHHTPADHCSFMLIRTGRNRQIVLFCILQRLLIPFRVLMGYALRAAMSGIDSLHRIHMIGIKANLRDVGFFSERVGVYNDTTGRMH